MILTNSPAEIIRQLLIDLGLATATGTWPVYASSEPDVPDNVLTVYDTQGTDGGRSMIEGELHSHYGFQVRVRSRDHTTGWLKAEAIRHHLSQSVYQRAVYIEDNNYLVQSIEKIGNVLTIGKESSISKRSLFTVNATVPLSVI